MSASPDDPDFLARIMSGINNGLSSPTGLLALSLLNASGPSRMPVSTGQALAQGFSGGQGMQGQVMQNTFQRMALERQQQYLNALMRGFPSQDQSTQATAPTQASQNPLMTVNTPTPTSVAIDALASGKVTPDQAMQISRTPLTGNPLAAPTQNNGVSGDPILQDPRIQKDLMLANAAPDAPTQTAWLTRARLDYDMLANTPAYKGAQAGAVAQATLPEDALKSILSQAGRVTQINPGEGGVPVSNLSLFDSNTIPNLMRNFGMAAQGMATQGGNSPGSPAPETQAPTASPISNMSGIPTPLIRTPTGISGQGAVYPTNLQKALADSDAKYIDTLQTAADSASQGKQNIDEMWSAYQSGLPTGSLAGFKVDLQKGMAALGVPISDDAMKQITNYEAFSKNQAQLGISLAKQVSQRPSQFEFKYLNSTAVANPHLQQASIPILLGQMEGAQTYSQNKAIYVNNEAHNGVNPRTAALKFDTNASIMPYALQTLATKDPRSYAILRQQMSASPEGRAFAAQIEKEAAWMKSQGLL